MIETTLAQFLKYVARAMVVVGMNLMPPKILERKACL